MTRAGRTRNAQRGASGMHGDGQPAASYAEDRCALNWPLLTAGVYAPVLAIALFVAVLATGASVLDWPSLAILILAAFAWMACGGVWLPYLRPTGIRLDMTGVRIGGVRWAQRHPGRVRQRTAIVPRQCSQVFGCPWNAVRGIGVTTDPAVIRVMKRNAYRGRRLTPLGNLATPFMRSALVIWVDMDRAQVPQIRQATNPLWSSNAQPGFNQPVWVVPTRHPSRLQAALAQLPLPSGALREVSGLVGPGSPAGW